MSEVERFDWHENGHEPNPNGGWVGAGDYDQARAELIQLAKDVLSMAKSGGMPDSFKATDSRVLRAQAVLKDADDPSS